MAANHPLAAQAGLVALRDGGNAVDAAAATALALAVVEPMMSGLGGDAFYHFLDGKTGRAVVFNGTGPAPRAATPERYPRWHPTARAPLRIGSGHAGRARHNAPPARPPAMGTRLYGGGPPGARWVRCDAPLPAVRRRPAGGHPARRTDRRHLPPGGRGATGRAPIVQPELARTLEEVAGGGAETFYRGDLASRLTTALAECGALITGTDLAEFEPEVQEPLAIDYRGLRVLEAPPNSTGFVLLQELKILENFDVARMGLGSADLLHVMVEAKKLAFLDRERWGSDPRTVEPPFAELLSDSYCARLAERIDMGRAASTSATVAGVGDTTYFCTADGDGNAVSGIQSINSLWGSGMMAGGTGVLLNNRMAYWHLDRGHPNLLRPGHRVRHTMNPPLVLHEGRLWGVFGTPGADHQVQVNFQVATAMIDFGLDPQQAVEMPRWTSMRPGQYADYPHDGPDALTLERRFPEDLRLQLAQRGHPVVAVGDLEGPCSVEIIRRDGDVLLAGSDPRRDGWALAW